MIQVSIVPVLYFNVPVVINSGLDHSCVAQAQNLITNFLSRKHSYHEKSIGTECLFLILWAVKHLYRTFFWVEKQTEIGYQTGPKYLHGAHVLQTRCVSIAITVSLKKWSSNIITGVLTSLPHLPPNQLKKIWDHIHSIDP